MDQRGSLQKSLAKEKGGEVSDAMMEEFKTLVTEVLTPHASAILLDPEWGLPAVEAPRQECRPAAGLREDRLRQDRPRPPARSARRLVGAPPEGSGRRLHQDSAVLHAGRSEARSTSIKHAWVERIGDECRANDIPFFLEFVGYEEGVDEKGARVTRRRSRDIVTESMREFTKDRYGVDVLKVEVPINMKFVEGAKCVRRQKAYTKKEAIDHFRNAASVATKPFIYLSAGVSNAEFTRDARTRGRIRREASTACSAAARPGRTASRSTRSRARRRSASGSRPKA